MCGIVGFIGNGNVDDIFKMMSAIHHRGPDDEYYINKNNVFLGFKRLSIIDLSINARQPMTNEDQSIYMVFNGEIYNYKELKGDLVNRGHIFKSKSDSEVVLHLFEDFGEDAFTKLNGMFALAIYNSKTNEIILARDRFGQKPLYFSIFNKTLFFASEATAILNNSKFVSKINNKSLIKYLFYEHVPTPDCIWENINKLFPGSYLKYNLNDQSHSIKSFWTPSFLPQLSLSDNDIIENLRHLLFKSVERHLNSDVPVGVYLSGGMDSTTIAYYAQNILKGNLNTFTVAFNEKSFDEQFKARESSSKYKTNHFEIPFTFNDFLSTTFEAIPKIDEPYADSSYIPAFYLNKFAKQHIKVALGGEGGDEIFIGYPVFKAYNYLKYFKLIPKFLRNSVINNLINNLPSHYENETWEYRMKKFIEADGFYDKPCYSQQIWLGSFGPQYLDKLLSSDLRDVYHSFSIFENLDYYISFSSKQETDQDRLMRQIQLKYLMDDGLTKADRASMHNSIEMRAPMLDANLVDWVNMISFNTKYKKGVSKFILKKAMQGIVPDNIIYGPKRGFTPPIAEWFTKSFENVIKDYLMIKDNYFNMNYIEFLWKQHKNKQRNHRKILWTLFVWKLWNEKNKYISK